MTSDADSTRERLLQQARDLYLAGGVGNVSLREVARRVGVSPAAVYRHFDGLPALLAAVCETGFRLFSLYLMRSLSAPTPAARLLACTEQYAAFGLENPQDYRVIFMTPSEEAAALLPVGGPEASPTFQFLVDRVRECQQAGALSAGDPLATALTVWAHVHGLVSLWISGQLSHGRTERQFRALYTASSAVLLAGLGFRHG